MQRHYHYDNKVIFHIAGSPGRTSPVPISLPWLRSPRRLVHGNQLTAVTRSTLTIMVAAVHAGDQLDTCKICMLE